MGINLYTGNFNSTDLYSSFMGVGANDSNILPLEDGQSLSQITNYVTASNMLTPTEDVNKEIIKEYIIIYPYFKTKRVYGRSKDTYNMFWFTS